MTLDSTFYLTTDPQGVGLLKGKVFINRTGTLVNPQDISNVPNNLRITTLKKDHRENIYDFDIPLFCNSDKKQINNKSIPVTYYNHAWYSFAKAEDSSWLQLVAVLPYIHNYNLDSSSDSSSTASSSTTLLNKTIRNSPAILSITSSPQVSTLTQLPKMATTTTTQTQATTQATATTGSSQPLSAADLHTLLHMAVRGGGGGGSGGGGGAPPAQQPLQPIAAAANVKAMGANPPIFNGNRDDADDFISKVEEYLLLNDDVAGFNSPKKKVALMLTFMQGAKVAEWMRGVRAWLLQLTPAQNTEDIWNEFLVEFELRFQDTQSHQKARTKLEALQMKMPEIDIYVAEFEKLVRKANYTLGSHKMNQHFIVGLLMAVTEDVLKDPEPTTYPEILRKTLASIRTKQTIWALYKRGNQNQLNSYRPPQNNW